jgi:uncharacterized protein (TIGR02996 family)
MSVSDDDALLAAIHAAPDDDAPRAVYADALQQRGDPRGEFIALQLAHARGELTSEGLARECALEREHRELWGGELGRRFFAMAFERGFLAGGKLGPIGDRDAFGHPASRLVTTLVGYAHRSFEAEELALLDDPRLRIRRVLQARNSDVASLAARPVARSLVELGLVGAVESDTIEALAAMPALSVLAVTRIREPSIAALAESSVLERLTCLRLDAIASYERGHVRALIGALARRPGTLRTIQIGLEDRSHGLDWIIRFERDAAPGPFGHVRAWWFDNPRARKAFAKPRSRAPKDVADDCLAILELATPDVVRTIEIDIGRAMRFPPKTVQKLVHSLAEMSDLEHARVPWPFEPPTRPPHDGKAR